MKRMIEWSKFENLERKYTKLSQKQQRIENKLKVFEKLPQAVISGITRDGLYLKRVGSGANYRTGIIYLRSTRIRKNHCDVCGKRRNTTAHHLIPTRLKSTNKELSQLRIRVCMECESKIHPENAYEESVLLRKKERKIRNLDRKLKKKISLFVTPFKNFLDERKKILCQGKGNIPSQLKETPKKITPAVKQNMGRIKELKLIKGMFMRTAHDFFNKIEYLNPKENEK